MKIVGITPNNPMTKKTPEQKYLENLRTLGHEVIIGEHFDRIPKDTDVIVAMSEVSCENAFNLSQQTGIPYYAHMEWLPVWRIFAEDERDWGMAEPISYKDKMNYVRAYQFYTMYWSMANVRSLAAKCFDQTMYDFLGRKLDIETKYIGLTEIAPEITQPTDSDNEIACICRFVPHKRVHHIIEALRLIDFKGTLNLVGYGPEKPKYDEIAGEDIKIRYWDSYDKFKVIDRSLVTISLWSGIVPIEALSHYRNCITYESPYMRELFGDSLIYAKNNSIKDLSEKIKQVLDMSPKERTSLAFKKYELIREGKTNTLSFEDATKLLESFIIKASMCRRTVR